MADETRTTSAPRITLFIVDVRTEDVITELSTGINPRQALIDWLTSEYGAGRDWLLAGFALSSEDFDGDAVAYVKPVGPRP